jgi:hypothetical protein
MMKYTFLFFLLFAPSLFAFEKAPWLGNVYEFQSREQVETVVQGSKGQRLQAGLLYTASEVLEMEGVGELSRTSSRHFDFDSLGGNLKYLFFNDVLGDPVSLLGGFDVRGTSSKVLHDRIFIHHGPLEACLHLSVGKEFGFFQNGYFRTWLYAGCSDAVKSSPWANLEAHLEMLIEEQHKCDLFLMFEKGFSSCQSHSHFSSYGHVRYSFLDLGIKYSYTIASFGSIELQLKSRLLREGCPKRLTSLSLDFLYPFAL